MTQKDFKIKKGLVVGGNITSNTNGFVFDFATNSLSIAGSAIATQANVDTVQANVASITTTATDGINSVQDNLTIFSTNATANINTVSSNVALLETSVNTIRANVDLVQSNLSSFSSSITTDLNTVSSNVDSVETAVNTIQNNLSSFSSSITTDLNTVSSNIDSLETSVNSISGNVNIVQDNVASVSTELTNFGSYANTTFTTNAHIDTKIAALIDGSPETLDTLNELAAAIGDDPNFAVTLTNKVGAAEANINTVSSNVGSLETSVNTIRANVDSVQDNVEAITDGSTAFTGAVTFNDNISADRVILNTQLQVGSNVITGVSTTATPIFTFPGATYRGVELLLLVQDIINTEYQLSKILIVHDGTSVYTTEYGVLHTGSSDLTTFSATIDGSDIVTVSSTGGSTNKKISVASHYLIQ